MIQTHEISDKLLGEVPVNVDYCGRPCESYSAKLQREIREMQERAEGRVLNLAEDSEFGCPGGVIEEWGGRLHFPERGARASVPGRVTDYKKGYPYVVARVSLRNEDPEKPNIVVEGCFLFPDGSALLPIGGGRGQILDVLATYRESSREA